jgi:hypothetical protein
MAEIKGTVLLDTLAAIKVRAGEKELAKIVERLSGEARAVFEGPLYSSTWYSLDAFAEFLEADIQETANGDREVLSKRSEKVVEGQLSGIYRIFVKVGTPGFVITRISAIHATYFKGVQIIPEIEEHQATIKYVGFQKQHEIMQPVIIGFFRKALELCGAKEVGLDFTVPIAQGREYSELTISWR